MWRRFLPVVLSLSLVATPQVVVAQSLEQLIQQGIAAIKAGNYAKAEALFRRIIHEPLATSLSQGIARGNLA